METASEAALSLFGKWLVTEVRDSTILHWHMVLNGQMKEAEFVKLLLADIGDDDRRKFQELVPRIVDTTLHFLMMSFDESRNITIGVQTTSGDVASLSEVSDGLAGELPGANGWIARFSSESDGS